MIRAGVEGVATPARLAHRRCGAAMDAADHAVGAPLGLGQDVWPCRSQHAQDERDEALEKPDRDNLGGESTRPRCPMSRGSAAGGKVRSTRSRQQKIEQAQIEDRGRAAGSMRSSGASRQCRSASRPSRSTARCDSFSIWIWVLTESGGFPEVGDDKLPVAVPDQRPDIVRRHQPCRHQVPRQGRSPSASISRKNRLRPMRASRPPCLVSCTP